jgi:tryptophan-rich sensory protein
MTHKPWFRLLVAVLVSEGAGFIGAVFTAPAIPGWYAGLVKPALNPPSWVFAPVWTTLYALMGVALFMVWREGMEKKEARRAVRLFALQLILNALWSPIFFGMHDLSLAFADLVLMWFAIAATIFAFSKVSRGAAWLLAPYLIWVTFAGYLNLSLLILN